MKKEKLNIGGIIGIVGGVIGLLIGGYAIFNVLAANEKIRVNLGVKNEDKTYLFSQRSTNSFKIFSSNNPHSIPSISKISTIIEIDDDIYVEPRELKKIINLASKNYTLFNRERKNYDGYVTINDKNNNTFSNAEISEEGEKIGEQISKNIIEIKNEKGDIHYIRWSKFPNTENVAEENCIMTPIRIADNYKPGATSYYTVDFVVIKLKTVLEFLNNGSDYKYDVDNKILYIIQQ